MKKNLSINQVKDLVMMMMMIDVKESIFYKFYKYLFIK